MNRVEWREAYLIREVLCFVVEQLVVFRTSLSSSAGNKVEVSNMKLSKHSRGDEIGGMIAPPSEAFYAVRCGRSD